MSRAFQTGCTIEVDHSFDNLHAHVELDGNVAIGPGDRVLVHGAPVVVPFGGRLSERRTATVTRAGPVRRAWTRLAAHLELTELTEVAFSLGARA